MSTNTLREALERAKQDINWMLNSRQFLNSFVFDYIDKALAQSAQAEAQSGEPEQAGKDAIVVAHRLARKSTITGEWIRQGPWSDGPPPADLISSVKAEPDFWRLELAYSAPVTQPAEQAKGGECDYMERLGFELEEKSGVWLVLDDCGNEREATLTERVLWDEVLRLASTPAPVAEVERASIISALDTMAMGHDLTERTTSARTLRKAAALLAQDAQAAGQAVAITLQAHREAIAQAKEAQGAEQDQPREELEALEREHFGDIDAGTGIYAPSPIPVHDFGLTSEHIEAMDDTAGLPFILKRQAS